jgi:hypothetical protein
MSAQLVFSATPLGLLTELVRSSHLFGAELRGCFLFRGKVWPNRGKPGSNCRAALKCPTTVANEPQRPAPFPDRLSATGRFPRPVAGFGTNSGRFSTWRKSTKATPQLFFRTVGNLTLVGAFRVGWECAMRARERYRKKAQAIVAQVENIRGPGERAGMLTIARAYLRLWSAPATTATLHLA